MRTLNLEQNRYSIYVILRENSEINFVPGFEKLVLVLNVPYWSLKSVILVKLGWVCKDPIFIHSDFKNVNSLFFSRNLIKNLTISNGVLLFGQGKHHAFLVCVHLMHNISVNPRMLVTLLKQKSMYLFAVLAWGGCSLSLDVWGDDYIWLLGKLGMYVLVAGCWQGVHRSISAWLALWFDFDGNGHIFGVLIELRVFLLN